MHIIVSRSTSYTKAFSIKEAAWSAALDADRRPDLIQDIAQYLKTLQEVNVPMGVDENSDMECADILHYRESAVLLYFQQFLMAFDIKTIADYQYWWRSGILAQQQNNQYWLRSPDLYVVNDIDDNSQDDQTFFTLATAMCNVIPDWSSTFIRDILEQASDDIGLWAYYYSVVDGDHGAPPANLPLTAADRFIESEYRRTGWTNFQNVAAILRGVCSEQVKQQFVALITLMHPAIEDYAEDDYNTAVLQVVDMLKLEPVAVVEPPEIQLDTTM